MVTFCHLDFGGNPTPESVPRSGGQVHSGGEPVTQSFSLCRDVGEHESNPRTARGRQNAANQSSQGSEGFCGKVKLAFV